MHEGGYCSGTTDIGTTPRRRFELQFTATNRVVELEESAVLPKLIGVGDFDVEALGNIARPAAPAVLHEVAPHLHKRNKMNTHAKS